MTYKAHHLKSTVTQSQKKINVIINSESEKNKTKKHERPNTTIKWNRTHEH